MNKSENITELSQALIEFQSKLITVKKDGKNPHFGNKYASLSGIIEAVQKPLTECGLAIIQLPVARNLLETILIHKSGEYISETYEMTPCKNDPQGLGSAITYQRRYALGAILCLNIDEDDDGNKASQKKPLIPPERFTKMMSRVREAATISDAKYFITLARKNFSFSDDQESVLADWEDSYEINEPSKY